MQFTNHTPHALAYAVHTHAGLLIAAGPLAGHAQLAVAVPDPAARYRVELTRPGAPGRHVEDAHGDAVIELGQPATPLATIQYDVSAYSLYLVNVNQWVSWKSGFAIWAYLYGAPLAIHFSGGTGNVLTGDTLQVGAATSAGETTYLTARGVGDWTVAWQAINLYPSTWDFQIWIAGSTTAGQPISYAQDVVLISQASGGWAGNYLSQRPDATSYLTIAPPSTSAQQTFQIMSASGGATATDEDIKTAPLPPDTASDQRPALTVRISRPGAAP